ncbi:MAG: SPASM domain-containing protein [Chlamydiia bacterium]|nr:SPASM domain-containing protein [Chlamydiia bacterium]
MSCVPHFQQVRIENTNRCGYSCVMCPRDKHTRTQGVMPLDDFELVLNRIGAFEGEMHLHGFGEPLLDKTLPDKVALVQQKMPQALKVIFTTLGVPPKKDFFTALIRAGLDHIFVSCYGFTPETYKQVHGRDAFDLVKKNLELLSEIKKENNNLPNVEIIPSGDQMLLTLGTKHNPRVAFQTWAESLGMTFFKDRKLHNYGDGRQYNQPKEERLCPVIKEKRKAILQVTWDLNVIPCCYDYNASIPFGNLRIQTLEEIFSSMSYFRFVHAHINNQLEDYPICQNCEKDLY